jgi:hypothetical protein
MPIPMERNEVQRREENGSAEAGESGHACRASLHRVDENHTDENHTRASSRPAPTPTHEDWARLQRIDPSRLDLNPARDRALQRLTKPVALLILAAGYGVGVLLALAGLDVARMTGTNAFGLFFLEAAFNGIAVMVLSAPLWFFALATPTAAGYREQAVEWITAADTEEARAYLRMVEGRGGLLWRFAAKHPHLASSHDDDHTEDRTEATSGFLGAPTPREEGSAMVAMREASWKGNIDAIDLDLYRDAVVALQHHAVPRRDRPYFARQSDHVATPERDSVEKNSDRQAEEAKVPDAAFRGPWRSRSP